jgi:phage terminase large subunit-like protein
LALKYDWAFWGRPDQQMPTGDWFIWLIMTGRGWGKTRTATENIGRMLRGPSPLIAPPGAPSLMSFVADTAFDMRQYSVEGPSGFLERGPSRPSTALSRPSEQHAHMAERSESVAVQR